jgi:hypothetical protein
MNYVILTPLLSLLFDMRLHYLTTPFTHEYSNKHNTHIVSLLKKKKLIIDLKFITIAS